MPRILRARNNNSPKTPRNMMGGTGIEISKNAIYQRGRQLAAATRRRAVQIKMVRDPASPTSRPEFNQFTNSTNPGVDLGKAPGSVRTVKMPPPPKGGAQKGHQKVVSPNRQSLFGGKTLKRR